jgi:hypothetical protein
MREQLERGCERRESRAGLLRRSELRRISSSSPVTSAGVVFDPVSA